ncbi:unnamed protein product [Meganyctiphanes norvegica]|uniref:P53 and DNA damage-regulated protein 1 n=1 Tax=Meganyctiphanes norvegica TaxID=48144 RepID=A0AAV2PQB4_MEGNR
MAVAVDPSLIKQYLEETEHAAEEIITDKQEVISLDRRRNTNREAVRALKVEDPKLGSKSWICIGNMFLRMPKNTVIENIEKEQKLLDNEIRNLRNDLRLKVNKLNNLEDKDITIGTNLKALSKEEWDGVKQVLGN